MPYRRGHSPSLIRVTLGNCFCVTTLGRRRYYDSITRDRDPSGREYFWIGGGFSKWSGDPDSDFRAVEEGFVSVTPLHLDLTNYRLLKEIRGWGLKV